jgi:hypothetical protein
MNFPQKPKLKETRIFPYLQLSVKNSQIKKVSNGKNRKAKRNKGTKWNAAIGPSTN